MGSVGLVRLAWIPLPHKIAVQPIVKNVFCSDNLIIYFSKNVQYLPALGQYILINIYIYIYILTVQCLVLIVDVLAQALQFLQFYSGLQPLRKMHLHIFFFWKTKENDYHFLIK